MPYPSVLLLPPSRLDPSFLLSVMFSTDSALCQSGVIPRCLVVVCQVDQGALSPLRFPFHPSSLSLHLCRSPLVCARLTHSQLQIESCQALVQWKKGKYFALRVVVCVCVCLTRQPESIRLNIAKYNKYIHV